MPAIGLLPTTSGASQDGWSGAVSITYAPMLLDAKPQASPCSIRPTSNKVRPSTKISEMHAPVASRTAVTATGRRPTKSVNRPRKNSATAIPRKYATEAIANPSVLTPFSARYMLKSGIGVPADANTSTSEIDATRNDACRGSERRECAVEGMVTWLLLTVIQDEERGPAVQSNRSGRAGLEEHPIEGRKTRASYSRDARRSIESVSARSELKDFLTSRRARRTPEQAGLIGGGNRRVPGLRRAEVAMLAGISAEYYAKIERGALRGISESVIEAVATALQLSVDERDHLFDLVEALSARKVPRGRSFAAAGVRPSLQVTLDTMTRSAAIVRNARMDILAANSLARALLSEIYDTTASSKLPNIARFAFLHEERAKQFFVNWTHDADTCVASLRHEAGRNPHDKGLQDIVGELSTLSAEFRVRWSRHDVHGGSPGTKRFHHPVIGDITLNYIAATLEVDAMHLRIYSAAPGSPSEEALMLLASWAAPHEQLEADSSTREAID